ncbi:hypothetical protein M2475_001709 [Breznakia sp. PF5-3]|uniref:hypothetical protein n=1 Tax=unclassified Breznakia TaxID=2623764 RepID=UPI0024069FDE|nr:MULTISPECIES: hypothetical protein [unclassified Breznakia]MDL2276793.1 hypothetical protein [Breznakia sp. OttesenSCG-928-G09]MDF9825277.1 hypothetical protein [Breznakia sp. PM6-1]MDF9836133.1 hypothetical protein [Breznakia sp. PF5-3]MDF9838180.1 hypothetical protein [Breznakia sp. PFB2-8]MDF9860166.1 hypothetical protein [Breznakia sp. PH5-24]
MNKNSFSLLAQNLGYKEVQAPTISKNVYAKSWNGFPTTLSFGTTKTGEITTKLPVLSIYLPSNDVVKEISNEYKPQNLLKNLKDALKKDKVTITLVKENQLHFVIRTKRNEDETERLNTLLNKIDAQFKTLGIHAQHTCPLCNQANCDSMYVDENRSLIPIHSGCKPKLIEQTIQNYKDTEAGAKNLRGILGLLLGGFVGAFASIFTILFLDTEFLVLYALIPIASFYGFKLLGGQPGIVPTIIASVWSFIQVFVVIILTYYFYFDGAFSLGDSITNVFSDIGFLFETTWFGFLSVAIGLFPMFSEGLNTANVRSNSFMKAMDNIIPYTAAHNIQNDSEAMSEAQETTI